MMSATALRKAAKLQDRIDRIDRVLNALDKVLGPAPGGGQTVWMGFLDEDGEGSTYGDIDVPMSARDAHLLLRDVKKTLTAQLRKLGVDAIAD